VELNSNDSVDYLALLLLVIRSAMSELTLAGSTQNNTYKLLRTALQRVGLLVVHWTHTTL